MIGRVKDGWRLFAGGKPGFRFRERYRARKGRRRGRFDPVRLSWMAGGAALVLVSTLFGWLPVLGWGTAIMGLAMIAGESYPVARLMDRLEVGVRRLFKPLWKGLLRLPAWARLSISVTVALVTLALAYGFYSLTFGG